MNIELLQYFFNQNWIVFACLGFATLMTIISFRNASVVAVMPENSIRYINDGAVIIDVREAADFSKEHIREAINLPLSQIQKNAAEISQRIKSASTAVVYCKAGIHTTSAIKQLKKHASETQFISIQGGITEWKKTNYPVQSAAQQKQQLKRKKRLVKTKPERKDG